MKFNQPTLSKEKNNSKKAVESLEEKFLCIKLKQLMEFGDGK